MSKKKRMPEGHNTLVEDQNPEPVTAPSVTAPPVIEPTRIQRSMALRQFLLIEFGRQADQGAGFAHFARNYGPRPLADWRSNLQSFRARPVK